MPLLSTFLIKSHHLHPLKPDYKTSLPPPIERYSTYLNVFLFLNWIYQGWNLININNHNVTAPPFLSPSLPPRIGPGHMKTLCLPHFLEPSHKAPAPASPDNIGRRAAHILMESTLVFWLNFCKLLQGLARDRALLNHKNISFEWNSSSPPPPHRHTLF